VTDSKFEQPMARAVRGLAGVCLAAVVLAACTSPIKTGYEAEPGTNFASYKTYAWVTNDLMSGDDPTASNYISPLDDARVRRVAEGQLSQKGLSKAPLASADIAMAFTVARDQKFRQNIDPGTRVYYPGAYGYGYGYGGMATTVEEYVEGRLVFHFFDRESKRLVWTGFASKRLGKDHEPPEVIEQIVEHILMKYPPPGQ
jgi:hypothetical protein